LAAGSFAAMLSLEASLHDLRLIFIDAVSSVVTLPPERPPPMGRRQKATQSATAAPRAIPTTTSPQWCTLSEMRVQHDTHASDTTSNCMMGLRRNTVETAADDLRWR